MITTSTHMWNTINIYTLAQISNTHPTQDNTTKTRIHSNAGYYSHCRKTNHWHFTNSSRTIHTLHAGGFQVADLTSRTSHGSTNNTGRHTGVQVDLDITGSPNHADVHGRLRRESIQMGSFHESTWLPPNLNAAVPDTSTLPDSAPITVRPTRQTTVNTPS